jgi:hypothetical protein
MRFERIWKLEKRVEKEFEKMGRINRSCDILGRLIGII